MELENPTRNEKSKGRRFESRYERYKLKTTGECVETWNEESTRTSGTQGCIEQIQQRTETKTVLSMISVKLDRVRSRFLSKEKKEMVH